MTSYLGLYILINVFCVLLVIVCVVHSNLSVGELESQVRFRGLLILLIVFYIADTVWYSMDQGLIPQIHSVSMVLKSIYFVSACCAGYMYFIYATSLLNSKLSKNRTMLCLLAIPIFAHILLCFINIFTNILFHIDADFVYHRDALFWVQYLFMYTYLVFGSLYALYTAFRPENYAERIRYAVIALFPVLPGISGTVQLFFWRIPLNVVAFTFSVMLVYLVELGQQVSQEPLTGLANRREIMRTISKSLSNPESDSLYYLFMFDIDQFKKINDTYGHVEGDEAIITTANALLQATSFLRRNTTVARYGGDEFAIFAKLKNENEVKQLLEMIKHEFDKVNRSNDKGYEINLSIGYILCNGITTIKKMVEDADRELYMSKQNNKNTIPLPLSD